LVGERSLFRVPLFLGRARSACARGHPFQVCQKSLTNACPPAAPRARHQIRGCQRPSNKKTRPVNGQMRPSLRRRAKRVAILFFPILLPTRGLFPASDPSFYSAVLHSLFTNRSCVWKMGTGSRLVHKGHSAGGWACCVCCSMKMMTWPKTEGIRFDVLVREK
jgi:hypothetical protein